MSFLDGDLLLYIVIIAGFLAFLFWGGRIGKKKHGDRRNRSFRERYRERRKDDSRQDPK